MLKYIWLLTITILNACLSYAQTGPGGVGATDGTSNLVLWLKHDAGVEISSGVAAVANDDVEFWRDQSGYGNDLSQTTVGDRPMFNGSAIEFRGAATNNTTGEYMDLTAISAQTIIIVTENISGNIHGLFSQPYSGGSSVYLHVHGSGTIVSFDGDNTTEEGVYALNGEELSASAENHSGTFPTGETLLYAEYNNQQTGFDQFGCLSNNVVNNGYRANIDIKEVIVYDDALTDCERAQVEAYLEEKYGLSEADFFDETASGSNGVQTDIDGIKELGVSDITSATSSIATLTNVAFLTDYGDAIYLAHADAGSTYEYSDIPGTVTARYKNYWWSDYTSCAGNSGNVTISFDLSPSTPVTASNYRLLTSATSTFSGATVTSGATINGNAIEFTVSATTLNDVYFTWGATDMEDLLSGPDDIVNGITMWLMNDAGVEVSNGVAASPGDDVLNWLDQSGNLANATQTGADKPSYDGSSINYVGSATGNSTGEYFDIPGVEAQTVITVIDNAATATGDVQPIMSQSSGSIFLHFFSGSTEGPNGFSWDGSQSETGRLSHNGTDFTTAAENLAGNYVDSDLQMMYSEWTSNQTDMVYIGGLTVSGTPTYRGNYDMKEIISYNRTLTACEKQRIETYLAAKHDITDFDYYDEPSTAFNVDAAQIYEGGAGGDVSSDSSGVLTIEDVSFLTDFSDGIGFANNGVGGTSSDVPGGLDFRIGSIWYIDYKSCNGNNGNIKLRFKLDGGDCGISTPSNAANYRLIHHNATTMSGATAVSGGVINGNYIEFTVNTSVVGGRYISLATTDVTTSGLGVTGPGNVAAGLTLWLKSDCGVEESVGNAAVATEAVYRWKDQSGAGNHALQTSSGDQATFDGTAVSFTGDADNTTTGDYMSFSPFEGQTIIAVLDNVMDGSGGGGIHGVLGQSASVGYNEYFVSTQHAYAVSVNGSNGGTGGMAIGGEELTADAGDLGSAEYPDSLSMVYVEYTSNQSVWEFLGGFTRTGTDVTYRANYDLRELIVFNRELSCSERNDVEDYLSSKYNIGTAYDHAEDIGDNGVNNDVLIIEENNTSGTSSTALTVSNVDYINDCVDTLWIANDGAIGVTAKADDADMSGLAGTDVKRWTRIWYAVHASNDVTPDDVTLVFDLDDYAVSMGATVAGANYRLITSASPWSYATVVSGPTINVGNNTVSFTVDVDEIKNKNFTLATTDDAISPLPVELISFDVQKQPEAVRVVWVTASEVNNDYFEVERSVDLVSWTHVYKVKGAGNSQSILHYEALDIEPLEGTTYYRLKQVDFDGSVTYSDVLSVNFDQSSLQVYPNPADNSVIVKSVKADLSMINMVNIYGQSVNNKIGITPLEKNQINIDVSQLSTGFYFLKIDTKTVKLYKK